VAAELPLSGTLDLATDGDARLLGEAEGDDAGWSVDTAGDVNGDGQGDLLVGAPSADPRGRPNAGSVYVLFGPLTGLPSRLDALGVRGLRIDGAAAGDKLGTSVSAAGDVDGDGFGDVLLGAPRWAWGGGEDGPGAAFLVRGRAGTGSMDLADPSPAVTRFNTAGARDQTGMAVAASPDMDGDGRPELIIGAPRADTAGTDAGAAFVVFSSRVAGPAMSLAGDAVPGLRLDGVAGSRAGLALDGVADVNGDGRGDLAVGAPTFRPPDGRLVGAGYVVFGRPTPGHASLAALGGGGYPVRAAASDGFLGLSVAGTQDFTGDGVPDIAFGSPAADRHDRPESGSAHLIAGKSTSDPVDAGDASRPGLRIDGASEGDRLGGSVADVPDLNADGKPELAAGAPFADALSRRNAGAITVAFGGGSEAAIDAASLGSQGFRIAGSARQSRLWRLAVVGDVDGDGGPDLLVGASHDPGADAESPRTGAAHIILSPRPPAAPTDPGAEEEVAGGCRAARNVELLIDDSGSMGDTDPQRLRGMAAELLVSKPRNEGEVLGAYEFGSTGSQLFPPQIIAPRGPGSNQRELFERLENRIRANNGGTNYNEAFTGVAKDNPGADARVFLTDGEHNEGQYENWHRGGPPTYVIGLAIGRRGAAARRLARIAEETGGRYFPGVTAQNLQPVLNRIDSRLNCDVDLDSDVDVLTDDDPEDVLETSLDDDAHSYDVEVMWGDDDDEVAPESLELLDEDGDQVAVLGRRALLRTIARPARTTRVGALRARGHRRDTFFGLRLNGVRAATLRITYRLTAFQGDGARVIAQAMESRRRR
jgi:hypothetical protein